MPRDATSLAELERIVGVLMANENRWRVYADIAERAKLDLPAPQMWVLARLGEREPLTAAALSAELQIPLHDLERPVNELRERGILETSASENLQLTAAGAQMYGRLLAARRDGLAALLARWQPEQHPDVLALINRLAAALVRDLPPPQPR